MPTRVVNLVPDPRLGGPQIRVAVVARELREHDVETTVAIPPGPAVSYFNELGIRCVPFDFPRPRRHSFVTSSARTVFGLGWDVARLALLLKRERADIVHVNGLLTLIGPPAARSARAGCVWHMNDTLVPRGVYQAVLSGAKRAGLVDRVIFSSRAVATHAGWPCAPEDVVFPPVDVARFSARSPNGATDVIGEHYLDPNVPIVVTVGNLNAVKGHVDLLDAISLLHRRGIPVQALCVGSAVDPKEATRVGERVEQRKLEAWVRFVGPTQQVERYLRAATVFVLPSHTEAMPIALIEAMAAGLPCIATQVGGVGEAIEHERSGLLVPPRVPERLADAIAALVLDAPFAARLGAAAQREAARFDARVIGQRQLAVYRSIKPNGGQKVHSERSVQQPHEH